jgi:phenylacetate-CoA ligase
MNLMFEARNLIKSRLRNGPAFRRRLAEFTASADLRGEALREWQFRHLKETVTRAYEGTAYYRRAFDAAGFQPSSLRSLDDVARIPVTEKSAVRTCGPEFLSTRHRGLKFSAQTSGSTGTPLQLSRDLDSINAENAFLWRFWRAHGKQPGSRRATVRADLITDVSGDKLWVYNRFNQELLASAFHLNDQSMGQIVDRLRDFGAFDLYAYPSTAFVLADYARRSGKELGFGAVFTSSEQLFPHQKELIEQQFHTRVHDWYGQAERVGAIAHCAHGNYHIQEDYSYVELEPVGNGEYELIGTSFFNHLFPLIRYRTGDRITLSDHACACGSPGRVVASIGGRTSCYIETPDGRKVSLVNHIPRGVPHLVEAQFVQESANGLCIRIVCEERFSDADAGMLIQRARERISPAMEYRIEKLAAIPRTSAGKFVPVIPLAQAGQPATHPPDRVEA